MWMMVTQQQRRRQRHQRPPSTVRVIWLSAQLLLTAFSPRPQPQSSEVVHAKWESRATAAVASSLNMHQAMYCFGVEDGWPRESPCHSSRLMPQCGILTSFSLMYMEYYLCKTVFLNAFFHWRFILSCIICKFLTFLHLLKVQLARHDL